MIPRILPVRRILETINKTLKTLLFSDPNTCCEHSSCHTSCESPSLTSALTSISFWNKKAQFPDILICLKVNVRVHLMAKEKSGVFLMYCLAWAAHGFLVPLWPVHYCFYTIIKSFTIYWKNFIIHLIRHQILPMVKINKYVYGILRIGVPSLASCLFQLFGVHWNSRLAGLE